MRASLVLEETSTYSGFLARPLATAERQEEEGGRASQGGRQGLEGGEKEG